MKQLLIILFAGILNPNAFSQTDTIAPGLGKLKVNSQGSSNSTFVVYWQDEAGNVTGNIELWKRELQVKGKEYSFTWKWYRNDTIYAQVFNTGNSSTMEPLLHSADYFKRGKFTVQFRNGIVTIPDSLQSSEQFKSFKVVLNPAAFAFPMDLEILELLPFKKEGQKFAIAFYEPGSEKSAYYNATVMHKENLYIQGSKSIKCWVLRLDYAPDSYAVFWIADKKREVIKMKEFYQGKYRYKVKLY